SFLGECLEAEKRLEQQERAIEIEPKRLIFGSRDRGPNLGPGGEIGVPQQFPPQRRLVLHHAFSRRGKPYQPFQEPEQQRIEQLKPFGLALCAEFLGYLLHSRAFEFWQSAEQSQSLAIEADAVAGRELERAAHAS